jgi:hypothetical protein
LFGAWSQSPSGFRGPRNGERGRSDVGKEKERNEERKREGERKRKRKRERERDIEREADDDWQTA